MNTPVVKEAEAGGGKGRAQENHEANSSLGGVGFIELERNQETSYAVRKL